MVFKDIASRNKYITFDGELDMTSQTEESALFSNILTASISG